MGEILEGDCVEVMAGMAENSVDSIVCDPPYALGFMGKAWDRFPTDKGPKKPFANQSKESKLGGMPYQEWCQGWATECLRIAKPGAYLLAFGGTRTFHRLACAIEDAGWTLRDTLSWNYGSGFPKSHDISKALDRKAGAEREVAGRDKSKWRKASNYEGGKYGEMRQSDYETKSTITIPATPEAKQWEGFGTALKPAWEPVLLFQKPLEGTYAANVLKWGCGALNIDGCRIGHNEDTSKPLSHKSKHSPTSLQHSPSGAGSVNDNWKQGRWPANFLLSHTIFCEKVGEKRVKSGKCTGKTTPDKSMFGIGSHEMSYADPDGLETVEAWNCVPDCPVRMLDEQSGILSRGHAPQKSKGNPFGPGKERHREERFFGEGGASRFFYCAKASRRERNAGLSAEHNLFIKREEKKSDHPTVKPIALMRYLCRLVTPPGGTVLDCFAGSGSTGCAAALEGFDFVGIEKEKGYAEIARARMAHFSGCKP